LIRHGFDRVIYRDWDFLQRHGMRAMIDAYYEQELSRTARAAGAILESGPSEAAMRMACTESSETKRTACRTD
jgi:Holliday junction resolvasome RuvABC ATP-dependent DNA helicase subunit